MSHSLNSIQGGLQGLGFSVETPQSLGDYMEEYSRGYHVDSRFECSSRHMLAVEGPGLRGNHLHFAERFLVACSKTMPVAHINEAASRSKRVTSEPRSCNAGPSPCSPKRRLFSMTVQRVPTPWTLHT